jgi:uncharacterized protein (TIGR00369 family)
MSATIKASAKLLDATRGREHPRCVVCGRDEPGTLRLDCTVHEDGSVTARFACEQAYEGYPGLLHGGVISSLADGAMTNCLFAHGIVAVTAELQVRFRHPVRLGEPLDIRARVCRFSPPLFVVEAELSQGLQCKVKATGKFMALSHEAADAP